MQLTDQQIEDEGICPTCRGKGSIPSAQHGELPGQIGIGWQFCEDCEGKGFISSDGDVD